jgi:hypothetical protein
MQPHRPYISQIRLDFNFRFRYRVAEHARGARAPVQKMVWKRGVKCLDKFYARWLERGYEKNLRIVLECVQELLDYLQGKIVVTADHGELLGENGQFFHPGFENRQFVESRHKKLIEIPWLEITRDQPNTIIPATIDFRESEILSEKDEKIKDRLKALGYIE